MKLSIGSLVLLAGLTSANLSKRAVSKVDALLVHDQARHDFGASHLRWDDNLANGAASHAAACNYVHSSPVNYAENIARTNGLAIFPSSSYPNLQAALLTRDTFDSAVEMWMKEAALYNYNNPAWSVETGHFINIVWKSTTNLGCAMQTCTTGSPFGSWDNGRWNFVVCRYSPSILAGADAKTIAANVGRRQ